MHPCYLQAMASRTNLERQAQAWLEEAGTTPPGNGVERAAWEGTQVDATATMSPAELAEYEDKKLKMRYAYLPNLCLSLRNSKVGHGTASRLTIDLEPMQTDALYLKLSDFAVGMGASVGAGVKVKVDLSSDQGAHEAILPYSFRRFTYYSFRKAMGENLHDSVEGEAPDAAQRRLNLLKAVEGDNWSAVIDSQTQDTIDPAVRAASAEGTRPLCTVVQIGCPLESTLLPRTCCD